MNKEIKPFLRWIGGKQNLIKFLIKFVPEDYNKHKYYEPFLGAGSMFFKIIPDNAYLSDYNFHLINCYKMIAEYPYKVHNLLNLFLKNDSKKYYYKIRANFNRNIKKFSYVQAAKFIYLNKTCFNGIYRVNKEGSFNVPYGYKENLSIPTLQYLNDLSFILKKVKLECFSYENIYSLVKKGDFVYLDPPYPPLNGSSYFSHYTKERFFSDDQKRLAVFAEKLSNKGCNVLISNADTKEIRELYLKWYKKPIDVVRYVSCKSKRRRVKELIIANYEI
ncbi:MAG: Dam family site-specific DNA-(adenine-N6)-methyltransferase [Candidatus Atribacteria bacterium]|nr:MAG: Dam family site-specific DNA-(adenine-N6)-methyltransferase [Candidatus Atribacteria bacterium]